MNKKFLLFTLVIACSLYQEATAQSKRNYWQSVSNNRWQQNKTQGAQPVYIPPAYKTFRLAEADFRQVVAAAPLAKNITADKSSFIISIPNAKGGIERFKIAESPVMSAALAARYPQIKSYTGQGIDDASATIRFDVTPKGFHGMILSGTRKTIYINPVDNKQGLYIVFDRDDIGERKNNFTCNVKEVATAEKQTATAKNANDNVLRTYRFAVTVGGQFSNLCLDGTETTNAQKKASVLSDLVTDLTRVNGIFERDFDVHLNYVDNEDTIIFLNSKTDPFSDNAFTGYALGKWNSQCKQTLDKYIGNSNYDCGHLLMGIATGGNAGCIGCVCVSATKGTAATGYNQPTGDPFVVDFWAHEIGHQFGANHTFDYSNEGTIAQMEPGSGSTIMGYAGTTGATDVQPHSDDLFHAVSIQQITDYVKSIDNQPGPVLLPTGNHTPTANAGADYIIPKSTPFVLTGTATDADAGDALSYAWEQFDDLASGYNEFPDSEATAGPVFRAFTYSALRSRTFPLLDTVLAGKTSWKWEALPAVGRDLHFRFTVRDNHPGGGSNNSDDMKVTVDSTAGPFVVTGLDKKTTWTAGTSVTITWKVANTNNARIKCTNVNIQLSTDGGKTFPTTLASNTANDGSQVVQVPNKPTTTGRVRIKAVNNVFFDISNANTTISSAALALPVNNLQFTAGKSAKGVALKWTTASETNNNLYEVERSTDGITYTTIGTVTAGIRQYNFDDVQPSTGTNYYRLKQLDIDGAFRYSAIASIDVAQYSASVLYPNPAKDVANIKLNQNATHLIVMLTNAAGKTVYTTTVAYAAAGKIITLPVARFAAGVYTVKLQMDEGNFKQQLLIQ